MNAGVSKDDYTPYIIKKHEDKGPEIQGKLKINQSKKFTGFKMFKENTGENNEIANVKPRCDIFYFTGH